MDKDYDPYSKENRRKHFDPDAVEHIRNFILGSIDIGPFGGGGPLTAAIKAFEVPMQQYTKMTDEEKEELFWSPAIATLGIAFEVKRVTDGLEKLEKRIDALQDVLDFDVMQEVYNIVDDAFSVASSMVGTHGHAGLIQGYEKALEDSARNAARSKFKEQKAKVFEHYDELMKFDHFKNGSRAAISRKIAEQPGVTVNEITIGRWIKAEKE